MAKAGLKILLKQGENNFGMEGEETMARTDLIFAMLYSFWNTDLCFYVLLLAVNLAVFLGGRDARQPLLNKEGFFKLCKSVKFGNSRSMGWLPFIKEHSFYCRWCYLPNAILLLTSYCFAASLFLCEVQNAQNGSLVLLRMLTECILYVIELQLYPYGILK